MTEPTHEPVMVDRDGRAARCLARGGLFVDCTVGLGGHSRALLEAGATRMLGLDRDPDALRLAASALAGFGDRVELVHADYRDLPRVLDERGLAGVDGALADLGVSSMQLDAEGRGFSFRRDEPLDMRMDQSQGPTAADLIATIDERDAGRRDLPVRRGALLAPHRARHRRRRDAAEPMRTTGQLAQIVRRAIPRRGLPADRSGDADVSGAADLGEP